MRKYYAETQKLLQVLVEQIYTPTLVQWMDNLDTGTQPCQSWLSIPPFIPSLSTNFTPHRCHNGSWLKIYIGKIVGKNLRLPLSEAQRVCVTVYLFCVRFHSQSSWAPSTRSLSKLHGSCILLQFCFLVSFVCLCFVCLFVCLFPSLGSSRSPGVNVAALWNSAHPSTLKLLRPKLMDENPCSSLPLESFINAENPPSLPKSWFDSCVSNELLIGDGTGNALYDKDTKWCQRPAMPTAFSSNIFNGFATELLKFFLQRNGKKRRLRRMSQRKL